MNMPAETNFDKLTDGNFHKWKIYMQALLMRKDLLEYVDGTQRHPGGTESSKKVRDFYQKPMPKLFSVLHHHNSPIAMTQTQ